MRSRPSTVTRRRRPRPTASRWPRGWTRTGLTGAPRHCARSTRARSSSPAAAEPVERVDASLPPEGYRLTIGDGGVEVVAADDAGAFYARATLAQLARLHDGMLPVGTVHDWPDLPVRGVMLDISRDKVPTP